MKTVYKLLDLASVMKDQYNFIVSIINELDDMPQDAPMRRELERKHKELQGIIAGEEKEFTALELLVRVEGIIEISERNTKKITEDNTKRLEIIQGVVDSMIGEMEAEGLDQGDVIDRLKKIREVVTE